MTRVLLEQNNSYASSKKKKNPLAKTHMSDAMELLDTGLESAAAEQMEQACKLDPVSTGKRLVRVRDQLEETLRETSHASVGPGGARRYSISSADDELIGEPSFVMEAGQLGRKREDIEVYTCPLLRTANLVGDTALHLAARYGHAEVATALLAFGAPHSPRNKWELTPLIEAVRAGYNQVVSALLQYGADPTAQNGDGENAVHIAAAIATVAGSQLMKLLLAACREEDLPHVARIPNKDGYNPVHIAKAHGAVETLKELMESLGPAEFFKTKGELRFAPKVASGDEFFLQMKDGLATTKRINSRSAWEEELSVLQQLKASPRRHREERQMLEAVLLLQALCRREAEKGTLDDLRKAAKLAALEAENPSAAVSDDEEEEEKAEEGEADAEEEPAEAEEAVEAEASSPVPGVRRSLADRQSMRRKLEKFKAQTAPRPKLVMVDSDVPEEQERERERMPSSLKRNAAKRKGKGAQLSIVA